MPLPQRPIPYPFNVMAGVSVVVIGVLLSIDPIAQDIHYHNFADVRTLWGINHAWNVVSNLPFIIAGGIGLIITLKQPWVHTEHFAKRVYCIYFLGLIATGLGSGYYHLSPSNKTLVWDRLPMTVAFMSLFSLLIYHYGSKRWAHTCLIPLLVIGASSVIYWNMTELRGQGDLRPYAIVQFLPMLLMPLLIIKRNSPYLPPKFIWWALLFYLSAKLFEHYDNTLWHATGISGHPIKHVCAAIGGGMLIGPLARYRSDRV